MAEGANSLRPPKSPVSVEEILGEQLYGVVLKARGETAALPLSAVQRSLIAAEDYFERRLGVRWQPTRVLSDARGRLHSTFPTGGVLDLGALDPPYDPIKDIDEPAYDYGRDFWSDGAWGWLDLSHRPVRDITQVVFAFPGTQPIYRVPDNWLRLDRKFGRLQMVPSSSTAVYAVFNAVFLGILAGARGVPQSIYVDYVTGYSHEEWIAHGQDLLQALRLQACLGLLGIGGTAMAQGQQNLNLGMDGLSTSRGYMSGKFGPYTARIELAMAEIKDTMENWQRREHGVPMIFV